MNEQQLFKDIENHLLEDSKPSLYLGSLLECAAFRQKPLNMLYLLKETNQSPVHHPEGNVWNHTMLVVDEAAKIKQNSKDKRAFMWAALLHDIGKPSTTCVRKGKVTSYDHDKIGGKLAKEFLSCFTNDDDFINKVATLIKYHMQILFVVKNLPFKDIQGILRDTDVEELALLGFCDRMGRTNSKVEDEQKNIDLFLSKVKKQ
jgi:putative nucleotidyltransferase with HDIG domain